MAEYDVTSDPEDDEVNPRLSTTSAASATSSHVPLTDAQEAGDHQHCLVCYSELDHTGILPCGHNEICGVCHLRLRHLHSNRKCPICKEEHEQIVVDRPGKVFDDYPLWGNELGSNFVHRGGMFFPKDYYGTTIEPLFGYQCTEKGCQYDGIVPPPPTAQELEDAEAVVGDDGLGGNNHNNNGSNNNNNKGNHKKNKKAATPLRALQDHLRVKHRLTLCTLCIEHKRDFVALLPRMAAHQLKRHLTKGDGPGSGFEGHPVCEFCRPKRFYDLTHLHIHLQKEHYKCHVCEKQGFLNQYFRNYNSLEKHFDRAHFMCHDVQCLQARFVVFENEIDLHAHERQVHGGTSSGSSKIQLEFRTRRTGYDGSGLQQQQQVPSEEDFNYGLQGEAFVPAALPQNNEMMLHPLHLQRTAEMRAHAAQVRQQQQAEAQINSFPTLQAATAGEGEEAAAPTGALNIGWTSSTTVQRVAGRKKNAGQVTESDFPALPTASGPKNPATAKLRAGGTASNRQFAAMRNTAMQTAPTPPTSSGWGSGSRPPPAATAAPQAAGFQYNAAAFPPAAVAGHRNRAEDLAPDNFPALGGGTKKPAKYAAATNLAQRCQQQRAQAPPSWNSTVDFPSPAVSNVSSSKKSSAVAPAPSQPKKAPSINSQMDFPPPPSANANQNSVKNRVLGNQTKQPSKAAMANMLPMPAAATANVDAQEVLSDMQASLGPAKYKKLKKLTKDFAQDNVASEQYIDQAAALFERGSSDPDFWKTMPALVSSCPNQKSANQALRYMESLRAPAPSSTLAASNLKKAPPAPPANKSWGSGPLDLTPDAFPTPSVAARPAAGRAPQPASNWGGPKPATTTSTGTRYVTPANQKAGAWGSGKKPTIAASVKQGKPVPGSVASAAAKEGPQGGTATKFMAQQQKQQAQQQQQVANAGKKKKNKKKEKDELRNLAFGR